LQRTVGSEQHNGSQTGVLVWINVELLEFAEGVLKHFDLVQERYGLV
jgi:hypothetical protein